MRLGLVAALATATVGVVGLAGCDTKSSWPEPAEQLPGWVYDAPFYYQPTAEQEVLAADVAAEEVIPHYYTSQLVVSLKRPDASPANCTPRLAVYYSNDGGCSWHKAGYFGLDQNFFSFVAPCEGTYQVRFVGPGMAPVRQWNCVPPHRVYHIDQTAPCAIVQVAPAKECYSPGEAINLSWRVQDANLDSAAKVTLYEIVSPTKIRVVGTEFGKDDTAGVIVPAEAANGIRFAVEARDKAGNVGRGYSFLIRTSPPAGPGASPGRVEGSARPTMPPAGDGAAREENPPRVPSPPPTTPPTVAPPATPPSNIDRTPAVQPPPIKADPNVKLPEATDPADRAIDPSYRPRMYPTTQRE